MTPFKSLMGAALVGLSLVGPGNAATYDIDPQNPNNVFKDASGQNGWYVGVRQSLKVGNNTLRGDIAAGLFRLVEDLPGPIDRAFVAFCLSPDVRLNLRVDYAAGTFLDPLKIGALGALRRHAFDLVSNSVTAGAFQLAIWEIVSESGAFDLAAGTIKFSSSNSSGNQAISLASTWLENIQSGLWKPSTAGMRFHDAQGVSQDLLEIAPVPLPAAGFALLGGLGLLAGAARRRRRTA